MGAMSSSEDASLWHQIRNNKNVALNFVGTISGGCSYGILGYSVMAAYIFLLTDNSNSLLGYSEGAQGLAQLVPGTHFYKNIL